MITEQAVEHWSERVRQEYEKQTPNKEYLARELVLVAEQLEKYSQQLFKRGQGVDWKLCHELNLTSHICRNYSKKITDKLYIRMNAHEQLERGWVWLTALEFKE